MAETKEEQLKRVKNQMYIFTIKVLVIFSVPAIIAAFIGKAVDNHFDSAPWGALAVLGLFFIGSWIGVYIMDKRYGILTGAKDPDQKKRSEEDKKSD